MPFKILLGILGNALTGIGGWMQKYAAPGPTEARRMSEENKEADAVHDDLKKRDLDATRRDLS
jgi:hypothetical protein